MLDRARHGRLARPGQPRRARDHALPRRPRRGEGGAPRRRQGRARPAAASARPTPTGHGASASGWGTCSTASAARAPRAGPAREEPLLADGLPPPSTSSRSSARRSPGASGSRPHRGHDLARPGRAGARRARAPRGCAGHAAGPRPRQLPVRDLVESGRGRRVHRWRHRTAPGRPGHRRHEGLRDAGRVRPVPDGARRRHRRPHRREGQEFGTTTGRQRRCRLVRRRAAALCGRGQQRQQHHAQQARHPVGLPSDPAVRRLRSMAAGRCGRRAAPTSSAPSRSTRLPRLGRADHDVRSLADLPENARRYVDALEDAAGRARSPSCPSARSGRRRSSAPGGRCASRRALPA